ncbi:MAG TPA: inner membrane CreD family protein [Thermohalobaculum sp.]|nr:inner membrane CreD family protein [Thermohalobaculum sp.]
MSRVIDLATQWRGGGPFEPLKHPAGVTLPFDGASDAALIIPELRSEIRSGSYDAEMIALLDAAVQPGDRVLVIGAGLGVLSTLIARHEGIERIIAVEANTALVAYLGRTHALNGVEQVETVNAVLAEGKKGRVPFFARRDIRTSSLLPHDRSWQQVMMVPFMDLNLILAEERISLIVSEIPTAAAELLARAALDGVERILLNAADDPAGAWEDGGVCALMVARGFVPEASGSAVLFRRADTLGRRPEEWEEKGPREAQEDKAREDEEDEEDDDERDEDGPEEEIAEVRTEAARPAEPGERHHGVAPAGPARADERAGPEPAQAAGDVGAAGEVGAAGVGNGGRGRLWGLVAVALLLALPLMLIGEIAAQRGGSRPAALAEISAAWGAPQRLAGPYVLVPVEAADGTLAEPLVVLPETLDILTEITTESWRAGAFEVPVYRGRTVIHLTAQAESAARLLAPGETARWPDAVLGLGVSDPSALAEVRLFGGRPDSADFEPGSGMAGMAGIQVPVGDPRGRPDGWRIELELTGSRSLGLDLAAGMTRWRVAADWTPPAFSGAFQPTLREVGGSGFVAEWRVPGVAHGLPRALRGAAPLDGLERATVQVELAQPVDLYRAAQRAAKFGLLFIVLTFGAIFLIERSTPRAARMADYGLIGAAQCTFFLLLLPLAERIGFPAAYALGATATVALLTAYCWSGLRLGPRAGWVTLALAALYAIMYPIVLAREHTLLMGAVLAFLLVAALMWGARMDRRP